MNKDSVDGYERCESILGLDHEWEIVKDSVYGNSQLLRVLRWSDKSLNGVLAKYQAFPVLFLVPFVKDTT